MNDLLNILVYCWVMGVLVWLTVQIFDSLWMQLILGILVGAIYYFVGA